MTDLQAGDAMLIFNNVSCRNFNHL